jgi:hypothetical protein
VDEGDATMLVEMGFTRIAAVGAVKRCNGNVDSAWCSRLVCIGVCVVSADQIKDRSL